MKDERIRDGLALLKHNSVNFKMTVSGKNYQIDNFITTKKVEIAPTPDIERLKDFIDCLKIKFGYLFVCNWGGFGLCQKARSIPNGKSVISSAHCWYHFMASQSRMVPLHHC